MTRRTFQIGLAWIAILMMTFNPAFGSGHIFGRLRGCGGGGECGGCPVGLLAGVHGQLQCVGGRVRGVLSSIRSHIGGCQPAGCCSSAPASMQTCSSCGSDSPSSWSDTGSCGCSGGATSVSYDVPQTSYALPCGYSNELPVAHYDGGIAAGSSYDIGYAPAVAVESGCSSCASGYVEGNYTSDQPYSHAEGSYVEGGYAEGGYVEGNVNEGRVITEGMPLEGDAIFMDDSSAPASYESAPIASDSVAPVPSNVEATAPAAPADVPSVAPNSDSPIDDVPAGADDLLDDLDESPELPATEENNTDDALDDLFGRESLPMDDDATTPTSRTWNDNTGLYHVEGELVQIGTDWVRLLKSNGRTCTVPLRRLSQSDFSYVQVIASQRGMAPPSRLAAR